jgi:hypothetical protein
MAWTWGSHHLPPYIILCASSRGPHPNGFLSRDSQVGVLKFHHLGLLQLWGHITSCADLRSQWSLKQSCIPRRELFNGMSHATFTQGNLVDSWLLVFGSQIANLTPRLSFGHNLCFRRPNEWCEPILDIYTSITFQWYKEHFEERSFDPWNLALKIRDSNSQHGSSLDLGVWGFIPSHSLHSQEHVMWFPSVLLGPQPCNPLALVASPRLGLWHARCMKGCAIRWKALLRLHFKEGRGWKTLAPCLSKYIESQGTFLFEPALHPH